MIPGVGHVFAEEAPDEVLAALAPFLRPYPDGVSMAHAAGRPVGADT